LSLILAHQYIAQMEEKVRDAVFGNVGTMITFRVGADDADYLEREFSPEFMTQDIVNLPKQNIYLKLMIDGVSSRPFSAETLTPVKPLEVSNAQQIIESSRSLYAISRLIVEQKIASDTEDGMNSVVPTREFSGRQGGDLHDAICQSCNKKMKVPFKPDGKRPVYCKPCLKKMEEDGRNENRKPFDGSNNKKEDKVFVLKKTEDNVEENKVSLKIKEDDFSKEKNNEVAEEKIIDTRAKVEIDKESEVINPIFEKFGADNENMDSKYIQDKNVEEVKKMETKSGKKIDFEGLLDIIKVENKKSLKATPMSGVIKSGETIKFD
jgi:CxxC-x17-CxxC domain-containing protein